eukprot:Skav231100  [mRNA]  locus=scaffold2525:358347:362890:- [translate_table: standard]
MAGPIFVLDHVERVVMCLILAEVVLMGDAEVAKKRGQRKMAMSFFTSKADKNSRMGMLAKMTRHSAKSEQAVELLFKALDGATRSVSERWVVDHPSVQIHRFCGSL